MAVDIEEVTISSETDRRLVLTNSQWAGKLSIGSSWTKLRIGVRMQMVDTGANVTGTPIFGVGLLSDPSSGLSNGPLSGASTSHFLGFSLNGSTATRNAGPSLNYGFSSTNPILKKIGASETRYATAVVNPSVPVTSTAVRTAFIMDIEKGSPNFTLRALYCYDSAPVADITEDLLKQAMEAGSMANANAILSTTGDFYGSRDPASTAVAVDEATNGYLNALCVYWNRSVPTMHFSEVFYSKLA